MDKVLVNGPETHDVFMYLRANSPELISQQDPSRVLELPWNFCKWICNADGEVQKYLNPTLHLQGYYDLIEYLLDPKNAPQPKQKKLDNAEVNAGEKLANNIALLQQVINEGKEKGKMAKIVEGENGIEAKEIENLPEFTGKEELKVYDNTPKGAPKT